MTFFRTIACVAGDHVGPFLDAARDIRQATREPVDNKPPRFSTLDERVAGFGGKSSQETNALATLKSCHQVGKPDLTMTSAVQKDWRQPCSKKWPPASCTWAFVRRT